MTDPYVVYINEKLKEVLLKHDFIGKLEVEINIKNGAISNMNIASRESIKI